MSRSEYVLEMMNITKEFPGVRALNDVTFRLRPGTVHALMGENGAGKSTLMKCLFGIYSKDLGTIKMNGESVSFTSPRDALDNGVAMVHQELNQVLRRNVMENVWLGRFPTTKLGMVDTKKMYNDTKAVFDRLEIDVDPRQIIGTLSVSKRQMVEIAKAVSYNAKILVLDEPTSSLTEDEVERIRQLPLVRGSQMERARDLFIFQMFTGLAYSDAVGFDFSGYRQVDGAWRATGLRRKTGVAYVSQLLPPAVEVLQRYGGEVPRLDNADYNRWLKVIGERARCSIALHSHLARHTFATMMLRLGAKIENVSRMLGHTNIVQTQRYAKTLAQSVYEDFDKVSDRWK